MRFGRSLIFSVLGLGLLQASAFADTSRGNVVVEARPGGQQVQGRRWRKNHRHQQQQEPQWRYPTAAPPAAPVENVTPQDGYVWIDGHYSWQDGAYAWTAGHWEQDQVGMRWQAGYWTFQSDRYVWIEGSWQTVPVPALPPRPAPRQGYVWVDGSYVWQSGGYAWTEGHWERAQRPQR